MNCHTGTYLKHIFSKAQNMSRWDQDSAGSIIKMPPGSESVHQKYGSEDPGLKEKFKDTRRYHCLKKQIWLKVLGNFGHNAHCTRTTILYQY